jgi:hypothetical protein
MNELRKVRGMTEAELRTLLGYADKVASALAEARGLMSTVVASASLDSARLSMEFASSDLRTVRVMIDEALKERPWCDGCGDGATGIAGNGGACTVCKPVYVAPKPPCPKALDWCEGPSADRSVRCTVCQDAADEDTIARRDWEIDTYEEREA